MRRLPGYTPIRGSSRKPSPLGYIVVFAVLAAAWLAGAILVVSALTKG